ncbi:hypothetical protein HAALTHF_02970n [Vreelandella aquamarina]|nr:hypothetical protein HAALTHF_02970n [Halomonas axialensis]
MIVDGNLDNTDADYTGRFVASTCYNSEKGMTLTETMRNERDWVVVFDVEAIEAAVAAGNYNTLGESSVPVLDGRKGSQLTRYIPIPKNPHGVNTSPDGKYFIANGKLSPLAQSSPSTSCLSCSTTVSNRAIPSWVNLNWVWARFTLPTMAGATPIPRCSSIAR